MNKVGGQRQHSFSLDSERSEFPQNSVYLGKNTELRSYLITVAAFTSAASLLLLMLAPSDGGKPVSFPSIVLAL